MKVSDGTRWCLPPARVAAAASGLARHLWRVIGVGLVAGMLVVPAAAQGDTRAFEMVTPADSEGYAPRFFSSDADGGHVYWEVIYASPADSRVDGGNTDAFGSARSGAGWASTWLTPYCIGSPSVFDPDGPCTREDSGVYVFAAGGGRVAFTTLDQIDRRDRNGGVGFAGRDVYVSDRHGARLLSASDAGTLPGAPGLGTGSPIASADLSTVVFSTAEPLLPQDVDALQDVYANVDGELVLLTANAGGSGTCPTACGASTFPVAGSSSNSGVNLMNGVSADGRRIFFTTKKQLVASDTDNANDVYVWDSGQVKVLTNKPIGASAATTAATFGWATRDGSRLFFTTTEPLLPADVDIAPDIYSVDVATAGDLQLVTSGTANVTVGLVMVSDDGSHVWFTSTEPVVAGAPAAGTKLFQWVDGVVSYVPTQVAIPAGDGLLNAQRSYARSTPDGEVLVFESNAQLTTDDTNAVRDVYMVRSGAVSLVSVRPPGASASAAEFSSGEPVAGINTARRVVSDDGSRVFFQTRDALVPEDTDNGNLDIYERAGATMPRLVSGAGPSPHDSYLKDSSQDGSTVFFWTNESLVKADEDGEQGDLYAARSGGGFPDSVDEMPCVDDECQGLAHPPLLVPAPGTPGFVGSGNVVLPPTAPRASLSVPTPKVKRGQVSAVLRVKVSGKGTIRATGSGLKRSSRRVSGPGTYRVTVRLSSRARRTLDRTGRATVRSAVKFTPSEGTSRTVRVAIKFRKQRAKSKSAGARTVPVLSPAVREER